MSSLEEKDFEDLRLHFSDTQWNKLKEVEKIIYLNQKSNHLFKLSIGLKSRPPHFMRTSAPQPRKRKKRGEESEYEEWITSDEESDHKVKKTVPVPPSDRKLRSRTNYTEPKQQVVETEAASTRRLRSRTNYIVANYTEPEVPDDDHDYGGTDQETSAPQPSKKKKKRGEESEDEEWIPSDEESVDSEHESHEPPEFIEDSPIAAGDTTETNTP